MDFTSDQLADGRRVRMLNVVDVTRECLGIEVAISLPTQRVVRALERIVAQHGKPLRITVDNGPEFHQPAIGCLGTRARRHARRHRAGQTKSERFH